MPRHDEKSSAPGGPRIIAEQGVHWSAPSVSGMLGWPRVRHGVVTPDNIFLFISKVEVMALPCRGFATESAFTEAARYAQAHADTAMRAP